MQQDPLNTIKERRSFFIIPYVVPVDTFKVPFMGEYRAGKAYKYQDVVARIKFDPRMIVNAPNIIKQLIPERITDLSFNLIINDTEPKTYNLVFHEWAGTWQPQKLFNIMMPMGIFAAQGVQPADSSSISFNQISPQQVWVHNGGESTSNSPNNARFLVPPGHNISSFWSVAISPNQKNAVVTFHILANTNIAKNYIENALKSDQTKTLRDFLQALEKGVATLQPTDQQIMTSALHTIQGILQAPLGAPAPKPAPAGDQLVENLETLARKLQRLSGRLTM